MKGWLAMLFGTRKADADKITGEIVSARLAVEKRAAELVKTLDEMLEAANKANARGRRDEDRPQKPGH